MPIIRCDSRECVHNEFQFCQAQKIELTDLNAFHVGGGTDDNYYGRCGTYEKRTDYVTFFEERGFG